jgi:aminopeptidase-like protein
MNIEKFLNDILSVVNGQRAWDWVAKISQYNRVQASNGYHDSLESIKEELIALGFDDIEYFKSPADGETTTWGYPASYQWEIETGELWIEEPEKIKLCDFNDIPVSIITHSKSCDITVEIVDIGIGDKKEDYEKNDIEGKIILMCGPIYLNRPLIEKSKAIGVIYYPDLNRTRNNLDRVIYNGFFTTKERLNNAKFGFSISYNQAMHLKELMKKGSVKVHASINAEFMEGHFEVLSSSIIGTEFPEQEIVIIAHLCHPLPSANDNASGAAGLLELARAFKYLIKNKVIDNPKRTLRFVWVPEFNGTVPWMKFYEDRIRNVLACINLDMIGEHPLKLTELLGPHLQF